MAETVDYFQSMGIPREISPDLNTLETRYLALSEALHPDSHAAGGAAFQMASEEKASLVNLAYQTLKDELERAEHLLALTGGPTAADHRRLPPDILESQLEWRERLAEANTLESLENNLAKAKKEWQKVWQQIVTTFNANQTPNQSPAPDESKQVDYLPWQIKARELLNHGRFLRGLTRQLMDKISRISDPEA